MKSKRVTLAVVPVLAAAFTTACGNDREESVYCVDEQQQVVEYDDCEDETRRGFFFFAYGGKLSSKSFGAKVTGASLIDASDKAANIRRGGFGSSAQGSGLGRTVKSSSSGGS